MKPFSDLTLSASLTCKTNYVQKHFPNAKAGAFQICAQAWAWPKGLIKWNKDFKAYVNKAFFNSYVLKVAHFLRKAIKFEVTC